MSTITDDLLPNIIRRQQHRKRPYATVVGVDGILHELSYSDLENASNRASWFLTERTADEEVLYMGPSDIRYLIWVIAAMKTGKCVLFPSLANQIPANQRFFETVGTKTLLYAPEAAGLLAPLRDATQGTITHIASPTYDELMSAETAPVYPFDKSADDLQDTIFLGLHTSGTSGHPKPIYWNNAALRTIPSFLDPGLKALCGDGSSLMMELFQGHNMLSPFPLFHFGGIGPALGSIYSDNTLVLPGPGVRLSPENYTILLQKGECTATLAPPSVLESMLSYPPGVDALAALQCVAYTGGPLNPGRGAALAKRLPHLFTILASTEGGAGHFLSSGDSSRWDSFKFVDVGQRMEEVSPGIYELVYPRTELVDRTYAFFHTQPHVSREFRTSDLFSPVDGQSGWWKYRGRADNWIAMSNGVKMDPTEMEVTIAAHPDVTGVLVAGSHRFRLCLLIELKSDITDPSLEQLWPTIEAANKKVSKSGRVPKELVILARPDKPFLRAGKGTIQRRLTVQAYENDIERLYEQVEEGLLTSGVALPLSTEPEDLVPFLRDLCSQTLLDDDDGRTIDGDDDLRASGLDSLSTFILLARLKASLRKYGVESQRLHRIDNKLLYSAATCRQLASHISQVLSDANSSEEPIEHRDDSATTQMLERYNVELQKLIRNPESQTGQKPDAEVVVLTGSTGSLGSYILSSLLARSDVKKVFCLNREGGTKKQSASFKARGLPDLPIDDGRVVFFQTNLAEPKLGLSDEDYASLTREATSVIHNAFPVNFLLSLQSFEPQFQSLLNLLRVGAEGQYSPPVFFVSSITAATPVTSNAHEGTVQEEVLDLDQATSLLPQGYARAKYVCEQLLAKYASATGAKAAVLRVGQVCGPLSGTGVWNASEWVPSLVRSSKFLGAIPDSLGSLEVNWVPVDKLGDIVTEIVCGAQEQSDAGRFPVYNVVNPTTTPWSALLPALETIAPMAVVPASDWVARLQKSERESHVIHENPAAKLVDFYEQTLVSGEMAARVECGNLLRASETAAKLPAISQEHMARWVRSWGF